MNQKVTTTYVTITTLLVALSHAAPSRNLPHASRNLPNASRDLPNASWNPPKPSRTLFFTPESSSASSQPEFTSFLSPPSSPSSRGSALTCDICVAGVTAVQFLVSINSTHEEIVSFATTICNKFGIESERVCRGIVPAFAPEVLTVFARLVLSPQEVCGLFLSPECGDPYNPFSDWNVTFPERPQPTPVPPTPPKAGSPTFRILHLSDTHYDAQYQPGSNALCGEPLCCRKSDGIPANKSDGAGRFGDYRNCDTPLWTLENMLGKLAAERSKFDYIYWTGDLPAHNVWNQTRGSQVDSLTHMVQLMHKYFPGTRVFPALGNHESAPVNSFPPPSVSESENISWLYEALAQAWKGWLPSSALDTVKKGAYYTVSPHPGFRVISLNMNYCNNENWWLLLNTTDPVGELSWLIRTLQAAEDSGEKVHVLGHIPPGNQGCLKAWSWNYYKIVNRYQNTIAGQFFGHTHFDSFSVFYDLDTLTLPIGVAYTAPSVTPFSNLNMGYRFYTIDGKYNNASYQVLDHETYFLNLTRANTEGHMTWELEYSARSQYNMTGLYPRDWDQLITRMKTNQTLMDTYNRLYYKSHPPTAVCDSKCRRSKLCEARSARSHDPSLCRDLGVKNHADSIDGREKVC